MTSADRLARLAAPTGRVSRRPRHEAGDYGQCKTDPKHGPLVVTRATPPRLYCPAQGHDGKSPCFFAFPEPER